MRSMRRSTASPSLNDPPRMAGLGVVRGRPHRQDASDARVSKQREPLWRWPEFTSPLRFGRPLSKAGGWVSPSCTGRPWATRTIQVWAAPTGGCPLDSLPSGWVSPGQPTQALQTSRTSASVKPHNSAILTTALSTMSACSLSLFKRATASINSNRSRRSLRR